MSDSNFDDLIESDDSAAMKQVVGMFLRTPAVNSVELELMEAMDLASELVLREMAANIDTVEFIELPTEGETEIIPGPPHVPTESETLIALRHNDTIRKWMARIALARSMGEGLGSEGGRERYRRMCAEHGMSPGESTDQLLALLRPYHLAAEEAEDRRKQS